jgi:hypothetical protein
MPVCICMETLMSWSNGLAFDSKRGRRARWLGAALVAFAFGTAQAAELGLAHYAPGAGELQLQIDAGAARSLNYGEHVAAQSIGNGSHALRVTHADGQTLAEATVTLEQGTNTLLLVVGNGSAQAPFELRLSPAHRPTLTGDAVSLQQANLAIVPGAGYVDVTDCDTPSTLRKPESYLLGTDPIDPTVPGSGSYRIGTAGGFPCVRAYFPASDELLAEGQFEAAPGDLLRRFIVGDGEHEPYRVVIVKDGNDLQASIEPTAELAGLWYPPSHAAGSAVQIAFDPNAPEGERLSALMLGFDAGGDPTWRVVDSKRRIFEYVGGNPDGTRAALPLSRGSVRFVVHSCGSMTLVPEPGAARLQDRFFGNGIGIGEPMRLVKLFPPGCRAGDPTQEIAR